MSQKALAKGWAKVRIEPFGDILTPFHTLHNEYESGRMELTKLPIFDV